MDQFDSRPVNLVECNCRLTGRDPLRQEVIELFQSRGRQIDHLRQFDAVELFELVPQDRIDLGLIRYGLQVIRIANALFLA